LSGFKKPLKKLLLAPPEAWASRSRNKKEGNMGQKELNSILKKKKKKPLKDKRKTSNKQKKRGRGKRSETTSSSF